MAHFINSIKGNPIFFDLNEHGPGLLFGKKIREISWAESPTYKKLPTVFGSALP